MTDTDRATDPATDRATDEPVSEAVPDERMRDEFDALPAWTAEAVAELGPQSAIPAACRGSGTPEALRWLADQLGLASGTRLVDVGAGEGGPAALVADERRVQPTLTDPMPGACRAAAAMFGLPVAVADGGRLPFADATFDAAWCLGVLCTVPDQPRLLAELRRVAGSGPVGLLVFVRTVDVLAEQPSGNHFPTESELGDLLTGAGLAVVARRRLADFPDPPVEWQQQVDRVDALIQERHGDDERFATALAQQQAIGRLIGDGLVVGELLATRPAPPSRHVSTRDQPGGGARLTPPA